MAARRASEASQYLLRAPFSLEKITWNESTGKVIYRSKRSWHTKRNFQIFEAVDFLAATVEHIPPKGQHTVRYYGIYSNKSRGMAAKNGRKRPEMAEALRSEGAAITPPGTLFILPAPEPRSGRALRPLWRDLIMRVWGDDPHKCPCCPGTMRVVGTMIRRSEVEFFLRLHGLWEGVIALPPPPDPPFDIEKRRGIGGVLDNRAERDGRTEGSPEGQGTAAVKGEAEARRGARRAGRANQTMEPIEAPPHAIWRDDFEEFGPDRWTESDPAWIAPELDLGDGRRLVLDAPDPFPEEEWAVSSGVN